MASPRHGSRRSLRHWWRPASTRLSSFSRTQRRRSGWRQHPANAQTRPMGVSANKAPAAVQRWIPAWWAVFLIGLVLWLATIGVASLTGDLIILPTIVLLGSFLVPVTAVVWYLDHDSSPELAPRRIVSAFLIAGVLG